MDEVVVTATRLADRIQELRSCYNLPFELVFLKLADRPDDENYDHDCVFEVLQTQYTKLRTDLSCAAAKLADGAEALRSLRAIYIDAGNRDEYFLDLGAEAFRRACLDAGAPEPFFELFEAGHGAIEYRYPLASRWLAERLSA